MKLAFSFALLLFTIAVNAQGFEGTITWSVKYDITDPAKKAAMEKRQNDPAAAEKMKKMQEQMNSPEMKKAMEANPQMKARMEAMMAQMQNGAGATSAFPTGMVVEISGTNSISKMEGGMMSMEILYQGSKMQGYSINRAAKTYTVMQTKNTATERKDSVKQTVTKTGETTKILGYNCIKYVVDITSEKGTKLTRNIWTTTEIKGLDMRTMAGQKMSSQSIYAEGVTGMPLRTELMTTTMNVVMEATNIKTGPIPASEFEIPADFTQTKSFF